VDGIILVVESGVTIRGAVLRTHKILCSGGGRILGVVLNKTDSQADGSYGNLYGRSYHNYYLQDQDEVVKV
jgi:Mrp family chromosome partitioning ATPase